MTKMAEKHGISKQFGGCVSSMFLHSVTLPSVRRTPPIAGLLATEFCCLTITLLASYSSGSLSPMMRAILSTYFLASPGPAECAKRLN